MAVRTIQVNLSADITNFQLNISRASRDISGFGSELTNTMRRISANTRLMIAQLGNSANGTQQLRIRAQGLTQSLAMQSSYVSRLNNELNITRASAGASSVEVRNLELRLLNAAVAEQTMRNNLASLNQQLNQSGFSNFMSQMRSGAMGAIAGGGVAGIAAGLTTSIINSITSALSSLINKLKEASQAGIEFNSTIENSKIAFETMLGSANAADVLTEKLTEFAAITPFEFPDLMVGTKKLLAFGFSAEESLKVLKAVGDATSGLGAGTEGINSLIRALGQIKAKGRIQSQELLQLQEVGVPALEFIAEGFNLVNKAGQLDTAKVLEMSEKGLLPAGKAIESIVNGMETRFPNMMEKMSKSWSGMVTTIRDYTNMLLGTAMKPFFEFVRDKVFPVVIEGIKGGVKFVKFFADVVIASFKGLEPAFQFVMDSLKAVGIDSGTLASLGKKAFLVFALGVGTMASVTVGTISGVTRAFTELSKSVYNAGKAGIASAEAMSKATFFDFKGARQSLEEAAKYGNDATKHFFQIDDQFMSGINDSSKIFRDGIKKAFESLKDAGKGGDDLLAELWAKFKAAFAGATKPGPELKDQANKVENMLKDMVDKVRQQAKSFADAFSLFDKPTIERKSGGNLFRSLQKQLDMMTKWKDNIATLKTKLGAGSGLFQELLAMGPKAAGQIMGLNKLSDTKLSEYVSMYNQKSDIASGMAGSSVTNSMLTEKKVENVVLNITGNTISTDNIDIIANQIVRKLKLAGVM